MKENNKEYSGYTSGARLFQTIMIALFAALSYLALILFRIPYPAPVGNPFLHIGNMVVILAALLIGGWQGGLSGSIGMGLYDILHGYGYYSIKTIILKFGIGLFAGLVARKGLNNPKSRPIKGLAAASLLSLLSGLSILAGKYFGWDGYEKISPVAYIFLLSLGALIGLLVIVSAFCGFFNNEVLYAALGAVTGIAWNVVGEFLGGTIFKMLEGARWQAAMIASLLSLPATLINGAFSIVGAVLLYMPLRQALIRARRGNMLSK